MTSDHSGSQRALTLHPNKQFILASELFRLRGGSGAINGSISERSLLIHKGTHDASALCKKAAQHSTGGRRELAQTRWSHALSQASLIQCLMSFFLLLSFNS